MDNFVDSAKITAASALRAHLPYAIPGSAPSLRYGLKGASLRPSIRSPSLRLRTSHGLLRRPPLNRYVVANPNFRRAVGKRAHKVRL